VASQFAQPGDFVAIAQAFGVRVIALDPSRTAHDTLAQALRSDGTMRVRVPIDADQHALPMVTAGGIEALDHGEMISVRE
jgi:thiamine pyrophosphate-dependent acetolactate synthase large subunit-like protein